jgi:hypothetical protein
VSRRIVSAWSEEDYAVFLLLTIGRSWNIRFVPTEGCKPRRQDIETEFQVLLEDTVRCEPTQYFLVEALLPLLAKPPPEAERLAARRFRVNGMVRAAKGGHWKAIKPLATARTSVNWPDRETGVSPIHAAVAGQVVELLLSHYASFNARDANWGMVLHKAAARGQIRIARMFLSAGAYVDSENLANERPLRLAAAHEHRDMLIEHRACVDGRDRYGGTALHRAVANGHVTSQSSARRPS